MFKRFLPFVLMFVWIASAAGAAGLDFVPNVGQARDGSTFSTEIPGAHVAFRPTSLDYTFAVSGRLVPTRMEMIGANPRAAVAGTGRLPGFVNVYTATEAFSEIPTFGGLRYESVYPGIDLELDGVSSNLKSTWVVAPNADPARIRWRYHGFDSVRVDAEGNLVLTLPEEARVVTETAPIAWQNVEGRRVPVEVRYQERKDGSLSFEVGAYDKTAPLVIDPTLIYNKKLYSQTLSGDGIAADTAGNVYLVGASALGMGYVTRMDPNAVRQWTTYFSRSGQTNVHDVALGPNNDVYVSGTDIGQGFTAKLSNAGTRIYETVNGVFGSYSIAVDAQGNSYIAGADTLTKRNGAGGVVYTVSFPVRNLSAVALDAGNPVVVGSTLGRDVYVAILDAGGGIIRSDTFGGSNHDYAAGVAVNTHGQIAVVGGTESPDFPLLDPVDGELTDECDECLDGFIAVLSHGLVPTFRTYFGGGASDVVQDVDLDDDGTIRVAGWTRTNDDGGFPIVNRIALPMGGSDAFVAKLSFHEGAGVYGIEYSTPLGDPGYDSGWSLARGGNSLYLTGGTQPVDGGEYTAFVARLRDVLLPLGDVVNINFQPEDSEVPEGYLPDSGLPYGKRASGWTYGWAPFGTNDIPCLSTRELEREADQQYDTYITQCAQWLEQTVTRWEIGVKPGRYSVRLVAGNPETPEPPPSEWTQVYVEGVPLLSEWRTASPGVKWVEGTANVAVADGRLTLSLDSRAGKWSLAFLEIGQATEKNQPPTVTVTSPERFATFNGGRPVTLHARADDADGRIEKVDFFATNGIGRRIFLGSDVSAPYSWEWGGVAAGNYWIDAVATDNEGAAVRSFEVPTVGNPLPQERNSFRVELKVFLPQETVSVPQHMPQLGIVLKGDDRGFSSTSKEYRLAQTATLVPSVVWDDDGIANGSIANSAGQFEAFQTGSSVNPESGRLTVEALDEPYTEALKGVPYRLDWATLDADKHLSVTALPRPNPSTSVANFVGEAPDPLLPGFCEVEWDFDVIIDTTIPAAPTATLAGWHSGMPAYEIYIDGQPVYRWMPPAGRGIDFYCLQWEEKIGVGPIPLQ